MADIDIDQALADFLLSLKKYFEGSKTLDFPRQGGKLALKLYSQDKREEFILDIHNGKNIVSKIKYQTRARQIIVLARLDLKGAPHENPDGERIPAPHLHVYKEGYGDKIAVPLPAEYFGRCLTVSDYLVAFGDFCNVENLPYFQMRLPE